MGLKFVCVAILIGLPGCMAKSGVTPADRVKNEIFRYDCCDPGLSAGTKELCDMAAHYRDATLVDQEGNRYIYTWSDCKVGEEPWRKWE